MKKILYLCFSIATLCFLSSCESIFDYGDDSRLNYDKVFADYTTAQAYLNTCYSKIPGFSAWSTGNTFIASFTDEAQDANSINGNNGASKYYNGSMTSSNNVLNSTLYENLYEGIRHCNIFLENIDKVPYIPMPEYKNRWIGETYLLRAYLYWELIKHYGPLPWEDSVLPSNYDYSKVTRPTFYECVKHVIKDCDLALEQPELRWRLQDPSENGSLTRGIAYAIKSEAILFAASPLWNNGEDHWKEAAEITKECLNTLLNNGYKIYNPDKSDYILKGAVNAYQDYFMRGLDVGDTPKNAEGIFVSKDKISIWKTYGLPIFQSGGVTSSGMSPSQELVDAYETIDGEPILDLEHPYLDNEHLQPNYNKKALIENGGLYDPLNPYENRDPRLKGTIIYNGVNYNLEKNNTPIYTYEGGNCGISNTSSMYSMTGYYLRKFINWNTNKNVSYDGYWSNYRLADLYLNYAEAELEANGATKNVYDAINIIRNRAGMPSLISGLTKDQLRLRLRNERRVEFAFEEKRYWDLRRWKINQDWEGLVTGMKIVKNGDSYKYNRFVVQKRLVTDDKYRIWPIPISEQMKYNYYKINMQNPGW